MNKKGGLFALFIVLVLLFVVYIAYMSTLPAFDKVEQSIGNKIDSEYAGNLGRIKMTHIVWPMIIVLGLLFAAIYFGMRKGGSDELVYYS